MLANMMLNDDRYSICRRSTNVLSGDTMTREKICDYHSIPCWTAATMTIEFMIISSKGVLIRFGWIDGHVRNSATCSVLHGTSLQASFLQAGLLRVGDGCACKIIAQGFQA